MTPQPVGPTMTAASLVDEYFVENRNRVLEVAAFLDRLDRTDSSAAERDFRMQSLADALSVLAGAGPDRVRHIQMLLSDPTVEPLSALDRKGAVGAYDRSRPETR